MFGRVIGTAVAVLVAAAPATADTLRIGHLNTFTTPIGVLGVEMKRGLEIALEELDNRVGGLPVEIFEVDVQARPDVAVPAANRMVERDRVHIITGILLSSTFMAVSKPVSEAGVFLISSNAGPSPIAGPECHPNIFATAFQNDTFNEAMGLHLNEIGVERLFLAGADYQAGWDHIAGVKRTYKGQIVAEIYTPLRQLDFAAELAQMRAARPDGVFTFYPGGLAVAFIRQWAASAISRTAKLYGGIFLADEMTFEALGDASLGLELVGNYYAGIDNPQNRKFVAAFREKHGRNPTMFAAGMYDTMMLIDSAVRAVGGNLADKDRLRDAIRKADFPTVKGHFAFNTNHFPIQNYYVVRVVKNDQGQLGHELITVLEGHKDSYYEKCPMRW